VLRQAIARAPAGTDKQRLRKMEKVIERGVRIDIGGAVRGLGLDFDCDLGCCLFTCILCEVACIVCCGVSCILC
jgi:hypothetical protein